MVRLHVRTPLRPGSRSNTLQVVGQVSEEAAAKGRPDWISPEVHPDPILSQLRGWSW
jgi:hypothetical protein